MEEQENYIEEQRIEKEEKLEKFTAQEEVPGEVLLEWDAPERPFKERDKSWFTTVAVIVVLVSFVALFLKEFLLLGVVFAITFVSYLLSTREPQKLHHTLTTAGMDFGGSFYSWEDLDKFWFRYLGDERVLVINTGKGFPTQLIILLGDIDEEHLKGLLLEHLEFVAKPPTDWMESSARWLSEKTGLS